MLSSAFLGRMATLALVASASLLTACATYGQAAHADDQSVQAANASTGGFDASTPIVTTSSEVEFVNINPAIRFGPAFGQFSESAHGTFGRFPANFETPYHTHSGAYHGVVIKGQMTNPFEGETTHPVMEPGSYWYVPANAIHSTACISATPCEFYFHAESHFDFTEVPADE